MHTTYQQQDGWFPIIGVGVERLSDLLFLALVATLAVTLLIYILRSGRRLLPCILKPLVILLIGAVIHVGLLISEISVSTYHIIQHIPLSWYPVTALTIVPIAVDIPRQAAVWYLLAYCVVNALVVVYGIEFHTEVAVKNKNTDKPVVLQPEIKADNIRSQFFTGLRISIQ